MQETGGKNRPQNEIYAMNVELFIVIWQEKWCANIDVTMIFKKEPFSHIILITKKLFY